MSICKVTGQSPCKCKHIKNINVVDYDDFKLALRKVFSEHAWFTIMAITESVPVEQPDAKVILGRLIRNPNDIKNLISTFVDKSTADLVEKVIADHLNLAAAVFKPLRDGNTIAITEAVNNFVSQGNIFSDALTMIKPGRISTEDARMMVRTHNDFIVKIASDRINGKYQEVIDTFDPYVNHMMMFSDVFASLFL